jgi:fatty-acyl-CoA synthase
MKTTEAEPARPTVRANDSALRDWVRALEGTAPVAASPQRLLYHAIAELAEAQGDAPALIAAGGGESLTYRALIARANRFVRWALDQGLAKDEAICLMMPNRPEYLAIWLGLTSAGVVIALINTELRGHSARPLHRHRLAETCDRRRRVRRAIRERNRTAHEPPEGLATR